MCILVCDGGGGGGGVVSVLLYLAVYSIYNNSMYMYLVPVPERCTTMSMYNGRSPCQTLGLEFTCYQV